MSTIEFMSQLRNLGIHLWIENGTLRYKAPKGVISQEILSELTLRKTEIITFLHQVKSEAEEAQELILPAPRDGRELPISFSQQSLWFFDQLTPNNPVYNIPNAVRIQGMINLKAMEAALSELVKRHESLRTIFRNSGGRPVQIISAPEEIRPEVIDFSNLPDPFHDEESHRILKEKAWQGFNLETGPLWRLVLLKLAPEESVLLLTIHHIISDAWSNGIFVREFFSLYQAFTTGNQLALPELPIQFADYASWQRERFGRLEVAEPRLTYWKKKLAGLTVLELPTDHSRPAAQNFAGGTRYLVLPYELTEKLKTLCLSEDATLFMLLLAAFQTLLFRYSGQEDILVGSVVANRNRRELEGLIGFFMNTLVFRANLAGNPPFLEFLRQVRATTLEAYAHQDLPFDKLLEELQPERDLSRTPLFQVMFILQNTGAVDLQAPGLEMEILELESPVAPFDFRLITQETPYGIKAGLDYCADLYEPETIDRLLEHYRILLEGIVDHPASKVAQLPILPGWEQEQILVDFNRTFVPYPSDRTVYEIVETQAELRPDAVAVVFEDQQLSYRELNARANQLASHLKSYGIGPDVLVGICLERSLEMVVSLLGVLKAGGAYVPFDPNYPRERLEFMLRDGRTPVLLTQERILERIPDHQGKTICLDRDWPLISQGSVQNLQREVTDDHLAYVIYTSGSTGTPKGAMNTHRGFRNHKLWMQDRFQLETSDRVLQKTPFSFDVSVWEFFWPLMNGACLVVARPEGHKDPEYLLKVIVEQQITIVHFVPSMLYAFLEQPGVEKCTSLRQVFCSGEALTIDLQQRFFNRLHIPLHNVYGPAESADVSSAWTCDWEYHDRIVPIGKPISNVQIYILDRYGNPAPIGVPGELTVGGAGLGRGYFGNPALTAEKFIPISDFGLRIADLTDKTLNQTISRPEIGNRQSAIKNEALTISKFRNPQSAIDNQSRLYRTGDLARWRRDGNIEFLGRVDFQVKIRGLRIELGEIEETLAKHPDVKESVVIAWEKEKGNKYLVGYAVPESGKNLTPDTLRNFLEKKLPEYMIPRIYMFLEAFPLNHNGKLDRKALPEPEITLSRDFVAPRNEAEKALAEIWKEELGLDQVGVNDHFFEIGGHSLLLARVHSRIKQHFNREILLIDLFTHSTISALAKYVTEGQERPGFVENEERLRRQKEAKLRRKQLNLKEGTNNE